MSTTYTGNPTAVQAPATAPAVNNPIVIVIPAGTDPISIESITQEMRVLADNGTFGLQVLGGTRSALGLVIDGIGGSPSVSAGPSHVVITGTSPTIAAGAGAGAGATASITGSDTVGIIQVQASGSPTVNSTFCTVTFANARPNSTFRVFLQPANSQTAALVAAAQVFPFGGTTATFVLESGSSALPLATYQWNYWVVG